MDKIPKSKESSERDGTLQMSDKWHSRVGVEEHKRLKENSKVKANMFRALKKLGMTNRDTDFQIEIEEIYNTHDMSGKQWDD